MDNNKNTKNSEFFNNFSSGDECLNLNKSRDELLNEMYTDEIDEVSAVVLDSRVPRERINYKDTALSYVDDRADSLISKIFSIWFSRDFILRRIFDVAKYSTVSAFLFGLIFVGTNYESFYKRFEYAYNANVVEKIDKYKESQEGKKKDSIARISLLSKAKKALKGGDKISDGDIPELGFAAMTPDIISASVVSHAPKTYESRIIIDKVGVNAPIAWPDSSDENSMLDALEDGVAHFPGSAMPGQYGNTFLTGHSSYYAWAPGEYKSVFVLLDKLKLEDEVTIYHNQKEYKYEIYDRFVVTPNNLDVLDQTYGEKILTLMTCTPIGTNKNRLIYRAKLVE
jgi:LPXTG-site transpeptidase (sortase) family protein